MAIELLQRVGLSKYEAEAYAVLLAQGPLTGYELGKRSGVPLSKSYEVLERLTRRGLAFAQPGEPARYLAASSERFLAQTRAEQAATLSALAAALADAQPADASDEFWVVRGGANVLDRVRALIDEAQSTIVVGAWAARDLDLDGALDRAAARGCRVTRHTLNASESTPDLMALLADDRLALVGTLSPVGRAQAVVSANPALALAIRGALVASDLANRDLAERPLAGAGIDSRTAPASGERLDWLAWEDRKHQHLWRSLRGGRVA